MTIPHISVLSALFVCLAPLHYHVLRRLLRGRLSDPVEIPNLSGRTYVITGAGRGIGLETALQLLRAGATVILAVRDVGATWHAARAALWDDPCATQRARVSKLDLASFASVRGFVQREFPAGKALDGLINNAHISGLLEPTETEDNLELSFQVNYLSHFLLTLLLVPAIASTDVGDETNGRHGKERVKRAGRVVHVTSRTYAVGSLDRTRYSSIARNLGWSYNCHTVYADTKLMQILFSQGLSARSCELNFPLGSVAVHPGGLVRTTPFQWGELLRGPEYCWIHRVEPLVGWLFGTDVGDAARSVVAAATRDLGVERKSVVLRRLRRKLEADSAATESEFSVDGGRYYYTTVEEELKPIAMSDDDANWLWRTSCEIVGLEMEILGRIEQNKAKTG